MLMPTPVVQIKNAEFGLVVGDAFGHGLRVIRIIGRIRCECVPKSTRLTPLLVRDVALSISFSSKPPWSAPNGNSDSLARHRAGWRLASVCSINLQQRSNALLDLVAAIQVNFVRTADGIADVLLENIEGFVEFAQQKSFFRRLGIKQVMASTWLWVMPKM